MSATHERKKMYVLEYVNSCCFTHSDPIQKAKYKTLEGAWKGAKTLEALTRKQMEEKDLWATNIRIINLDNYPEEVYYSEIEKYLYEYEDNEVPKWIQTIPQQAN